MLHIRLKEELARLCLKAATAAKAIGEPDSQGLRDVIGGRKRLSADMLSMLTETGVDALYVLTGQRIPTIPTSPDEQVLLDGYRSLDPAMKKRMLAFMLGGDMPNPKQAQSINVTSNGAPAAGGDITTHHGKFSGAKIGGVIEGDFSGTANVQVGKKAKP